MVVIRSKDEFNIFRVGHTAGEIAARLECSLFQAALLEMRGISSETNDSVIKSWISPDLRGMLDGLHLGGADKTAADLFRTLGEGSDVVVYGDYDVDGISSTALVLEMVLHRKASVRYFIPHRFKQGYGVHPEVAASIVKRKCDLVVAVDCGTQDVEAIKVIRKSGIPVIVLDHHLAEGEVAPSSAMVNPQTDGDVLAKKLCAAGVIWCWAWQHEILPHEKLLGLLDLVALATVADCVSLASPLNRVLVRDGLDVLRKTPRPGLALLMEKVGLTPSLVETEDLAMKIIPCLNAAGRLYLADLAVKVLFNSEGLPAIVDKIIELNRKRRELSSKILEQVDGDNFEPYRYVLTDDDWSVGVLSSVASRLCSERNTPIALVASVNGLMRGTLRMPAGGDAIGILKALAPKLNTWGGHRLAAGFSVKTEKWPELREEMEEMLSEVKVSSEREDLLCWSPYELGLADWNEAQKLGPFGMDNPAPKLYSPYNGNIKVMPIGKNGKHVKIDLGGATLIGFGAAELIKERSGLLGWVYRPRIDTWRNVTSLQLVLEKMLTA